MGKIVSIHSYRGGTGKSNLTANLAYQAACTGLRIAVIDSDLQSPGVHMILGLDRTRISNTLTDFVAGRCELEDAAYDMTEDLGITSGALYLLPCSMKLESIMTVLDQGYDVARLNKEFVGLIDALSLDFLLVDTHPGLNKETMLTTAISHGLVILIRPDRQDFHGTAVLVELAKRLGVPNILMVANKVTRNMNVDEVRERVHQTFGYEVVGILPLDEQMASLGSRGLFTRKWPDHPLSQEIKSVTDLVIKRMQQDGA
jgi:MinD-like ATPase involved in chromosome partitioning or flagellar assembly